MSLAILAHGRFPDRAKTALGVLRYSDETVVAVIDRETAGGRVADFVPDIQDAPIVDNIDAVSGADTLLIGIAPIGGDFEQSWRADVRGALESGYDVISGLHYFLNDDPEFAALADDYDCEIWDVRQPPASLSVATGAAGSVDAEVICTVGTDCSVGKMTTTMELADAAQAAGYSATIIPTGQTGIIIEGWGVPVDRVISDYAAGAVESMVLEASEEYDYLFVEGQGSIVHPAYSAVTCGILHGSMADKLVCCHAAGREAVHGYESFSLPPPAAIADLYERVAAPVADAPVVAGSLNTHDLEDAAAQLAVDTFREELEVPATDPVRFGTDELLAVVT